MRSWTDRQLADACLTGDEHAWETLIARYKRLIYSAPFKYRASREDAADIFQAVCLELYTSLPRLRNAESLRSWIITVAVHRCFHWKQRQLRTSRREGNALDADHASPQFCVDPAFTEELEREQIVREAVAALPDRCRELVRLLFYEDPPVPYREAAERLGLATGSIGFIRGRCLKRLLKVLQEAGF